MYHLFIFHTSQKSRIHSFPPSSLPDLQWFSLLDNLSPLFLPHLLWRILAKRVQCLYKSRTHCLQKSEHPSVSAWLLSLRRLSDSFVYRWTPLLLNALPCCFHSCRCRNPRNLYSPGGQGAWPNLEASVDSHPSHTKPSFYYSPFLPISKHLSVMGRKFNNVVAKL